MGGHNAGEVASEETLSNLKYFIMTYLVDWLLVK
jgi:serine/threonine protein phosphatase PrpC